MIRTLERFVIGFGLVAAAACLALSMAACGELSDLNAPEPPSGSWTKVADPPAPIGARMKPDWSDWVNPGESVHVPDTICREAGSYATDKPIRPSDFSVWDEDGKQFNQVPPSAADRRAGNGSSWVDYGDRAVVGYVEVNRDFVSFSEDRLAVGVWCG